MILRSFPNNSYSVLLSDRRSNCCLAQFIAAGSSWSLRSIGTYGRSHQIRNYLA